jgi:hypothetical protein
MLILVRFGFRDDRHCGGQGISRKLELALAEQQCAL